jgi:hypothetical protein
MTQLSKERLRSLISGLRRLDGGNRGLGRVSPVGELDVGRFARLAGRQFQRAARGYSRRPGFSRDKPIWFS